MRYCGSRSSEWWIIALVFARVCPGRHFALRTVYLVVASVLSAFDIEPTLDEDGNPKMPKAEFNSLLVRYVFLASSTLAITVLSVTRHYVREPKPFKCTIRPRSEGAAKLVKETYDSTSC